VTDETLRRLMWERDLHRLNDHIDWCASRFDSLLASMSILLVVVVTLSISNLH
jgi:hypothetical protein